MINHLDAWEWNTFNVGMRHALKPKKNINHLDAWQGNTFYVGMRHALKAHGRLEKDAILIHLRNFIYIYFWVFIKFIYI
jgi:hypothetical protein